MHYCLCGEFLLVLDSPLSALPRRPADASLVLPNSGPSQRVYKLNVSQVGKDLVKPDAVKAAEGDTLVGGSRAYGAAGREGNGVLVNREGGFEFQRAWMSLGSVPSARRRARADEAAWLVGRREALLPAVSAPGGLRDRARRRAARTRDLHSPRYALPTSDTAS